MLPRRFYFQRSTPSDAPVNNAGLLKQVTMALAVVFVLALIAALATEAISLITPPGGLAIVP